MFYGVIWDTSTSELTLKDLSIFSKLYPSPKGEMLYPVVIGFIGGEENLSSSQYTKYKGNSKKGDYAAYGMATACSNQLMAGAWKGIDFDLNQF